MGKYNFEKLAKVFIWFGIIIILASISLFLYKQHLFDFNNTIHSDQFGLFGDFIGGFAGSIWALAGIFLFYAALKFQKDELQLQREQLNLQMKELHDQTAQFTVQNSILTKQRFENTFFQLLALFIDIIDKSAIGNDYSRRAIFEYLLGRLRNITDNARKINIGTSAVQIKPYNSFSLDQNTDIIRNSYSEFFNKYQDILGHYFRHLYQIFKYIHLTNLISDKEKQFYSNIVRAQLSTYELVLLFYNSLVEHLGYPKFNFLINEYDVLQNLNTNEILDTSHNEIFNNLKINEDPFSN